jgi:LDH2 family malate/lactate/ureidoglycolate dehydrogenase
MQLTIAEATELAVRTLTRHRMSERCARLAAEHLVDAALCGHEFSSLARLLAIVEALQKKPPAAEIRVVHETANSALIDGGDNIGYAVSITAIDKAIEICARSGVAIVGANNTWFSGRLAYYVERAARRGYVAMHTTNTTALVAPFGGIDRVIGTNPLAFAFPCEGDPVVIDIGTSATSWGDVVLSAAKGETLPAGVAIDAGGQPTDDPNEALAGAFLPWGGRRGSGLSLVVQLFGILAGSQVVIDGIGNYGLFFLVLDPALLMPGEQFKSRASELREVIHATRLAKGASQVRVPGEGSIERRKRSTAAGVIQVDDRVYSKILELSA